MSRPRVRWTKFSFERLLDLRLCDLDLKIEGTWLEANVARLHHELENRGLLLRPHCWLSDEWFSPVSTPGIAIPFYLAHPRLMQLERREMFQVEGGTRRECMKLLRHEAAHAIQTAHEVHRRRRWQQLFGRSTQPYPDSYRPNPTSRRFVLHLEAWYAQSHPDEDFAETFAVWLDPRSRWRRRYARWPALKKLEYVDELMEELADIRPRVRRRGRPNRLSTLKQTLRSHYVAKRERYSVNLTTPYDEDIRRLFSAPDRGRTGMTAAAFLRRHRKEIRELVSRWTGEYQFAVDQVLMEIMVRARQMKLRARGSTQRLKTECAILIAVQTVHMLRRRDWHAV